MNLREKLRKPKTLSALQSRLSSEKEKTPLDLRELLSVIVKEEIEKLAEPIKEKIAKAIDKKEIAKLVRPVKGFDYRDGKDGENGSPDTPDEVVSKVNKAGKKVFITSVAGLQKDLDTLFGKMETTDEIVNEVRNKKDPEILDDTPQEIVEKVNKAGGVQISSVENLEEELKKIRQRVSRDGIQRGGGGGVGTTQHEQFALTAGTTSVTLAYNVAMGGYGIMGAYVQGQFIARGTHYTVSGKTISLLFTPDNGTTMDVVYTRS